LLGIDLMPTLRNVLGLALFAIAAVPACTIAPRDNKNDLNANTGAAAPAALPTLQAAAAAPPAATTAAPAPAAPPAPVAAPAPKPVVVAAPPPPPQTVVVQTVPAADPIATCRNRFTRECTISCNTKVNQTTAPSQRRIAHDICFGECTRAAFNRCK
jgi:hypothetical protein